MFNVILFILVQILNCNCLCRAISLVTKLSRPLPLIRLLSTSKYATVMSRDKISNAYNEFHPFRRGTTIVKHAIKISLLLFCDQFGVVWQYLTITTITVLCAIVKTRVQKIISQFYTINVYYNRVVFVFKNRSTLITSSGRQELKSSVLLVYIV